MGNHFVQTPCCEDSLWKEGPRNQGHPSTSFHRQPVCVDTKTDQRRPRGSDFSIHMSMESFTDQLRPINLPKNTKPDDPLSASQVKILRAVNGSLTWLSSQARPDLCVQTSLSQQAFPRPRIEDFRMANHAIRRAISRTVKWV